MEEHESSLERNYHAVLKEIRSYSAFQRGFLGPRRLIAMQRRLGHDLWKTWRRFDPLLEVQDDDIRATIEGVASEDERKHSYFRIVAAEYPGDALATHLLRAFPRVDFKALLELHEAKKELIQWGQPKAIAGAVLGVGALVAQTIPASLVTRVVGWSEVQFKEYLFWATLGVLAYVVLGTAPLWTRLDRARGEHGAAAVILKRTALTQQAARRPDGSR